MIVTTKSEIGLGYRLEAPRRREYYDKVARWCLDRNIRINLLGSNIDLSDIDIYIYHWDIECSEEDFLIFTLAWTATIEEK